MTKKISGHSFELMSLLQSSTEGYGRALKGINKHMLFKLYAGLNILIKYNEDQSYLLKITYSLRNNHHFLSYYSYFDRRDCCQFH